MFVIKKKKKMNLQSVPQSGENTGSKFSNKIPQETNLHSKTGTEIELIKQGGMMKGNVTKRETQQRGSK